MKKVWDNYSYAIILFAVSIAFGAVFAGQFNTSDKEYITVTVEEGESIWQIAEKFSGDHKLTTDQFISWVEKQNGINGNNILAGEELVVPVSTENRATTEIAGGME
ncbi:cell division suppressor protein YneA [Bacillus sp. T33-2]|uniref:cell division suppressor protein YneA n=1 Tax=Bacillus sp. T33-2 TaxID=2054168 RepID=UPI000C767AAB|nr:cell division suppressor protein YneA [Bacillus sp. T33-2]